MTLPSALRPLVLALLVAAAATLVFWPGTSGSFLFDDYDALVENSALHLETFSWEGFMRAATSFQPGGGARPLAMASFALDYLAGGLDPFVYKRTGLLVHAANAALVFFLALRLLALAGVGERHRPPAALALALLWAVHPLQVSTALYVVQRMETLSLFFVLLALIAYVAARQRQQEGRRAWPWLLAVLPLLALGLLAKESAALFPAYALALELTVLGFRAARPGVARTWRLAYCAGTLAALALFAFVVAPHYWAAEPYPYRDFNTAERLLTQLRVLPAYLGQMLLPLPRFLTFYYDTLEPSRGLFDPPTTALGGLFLATLAAAAWALRRRRPLFALGVFWFFAAHLITSNVVPLELMFEHRNYFALFGVLLALADLVRLVPTRDGPAIKYLGVGALVAGFAVFGAIRAAMWSNPLMLAMELAERNPDSPRAALDLGIIYYGMADGNPDSPFLDMARRQLEHAAALPRAGILPDANLILLAALRDEPSPQASWDRLQRRLRTIPLTPETMNSLTNLLSARRKGHPVDEHQLLAAFDILFSRGPQPAFLYAQVGDFALNFAGDEARALGYFRQAIEHAQSQPELPGQIVANLLQEGRFALAAELAEYARGRGLLPTAPEGANSRITKNAN